MDITLACSVGARLRGLLGKTSFDGALLLAPCGDIHTYGMKAPLDIAFVDMYGVVLESYRDVGPRHRLRCKGAKAVLERFACGDAWPSQGEKVLIEVEGERRGHETVPGMQGSGIR